MNKNQMSKDLLIPLLATIQERVMQMFAEAVRPPVPESFSAMGQTREEGMRELWAELLRAYLHEGGHRAMIQHLAPDAAVHVEVDVAPTLQEEGVGLSIRGARCGTSHESFGREDSHAEVMVAVAGWIAECVGAARGAAIAVAEDRELPASPFPSLTGVALASLWTSGDAFTKAFPGCEQDAEQMRTAASRWVDASLLEDDADPEARRAAIRAAADKIALACDAALRVIVPQAEALAARAVEDAGRHYGVIVETLPMIAQAVERLNGASAGLFTTEAILERVARGGGSHKHVWTKEESQ